MQRILRIAKSFAVVDSHQTPQPRNFLSRREQRRLLLLVMSLGLVAFLMSQARDPSNWAWFFASRADGNGSPSVPAEDAPVDDRLPQKRPKEEVPGTFASPSPRKAEGETAGGYFPGVKSSYLDAVRDDTMFRPQDHDAWFHLFAILNKTDEARLRRESTGRVTYNQLYRQSGQYRGQLVTVRGRILDTSLQPAPDNDYQIDQYHLTALQPTDNRSELMIVYCLHLPEGFPRDRKCSEKVEVTGFYFKRWPTPIEDKPHSRPVLLARTVRWYKAPPALKEPAAGAASLLVLIALALCVSLLLAGYVYVRTRRASSREPAVPPQFDTLREAEIPSGPRLPWETADRQGPEA